MEQKAKPFPPLPEDEGEPLKKVVELETLDEKE